MYFEKLVAKLQTEQQMYKIWLLSQKPDEILRHSREYYVRESILDCLTNDMVEYVLTEEQAKALLDVKSPFKEIYKAFSQYDDMDEIQETIEFIANEKILKSRKPASPITDIERELNGIRTTPEYQEIYKLVEEIEYNQDYSREKMIQVCKYRASLSSKEKYDLLSDDLIEKMYMQDKEDIRTPYIVMAIENSYESDIGNYETIEEAFKVADALWDKNVRNLHKYDMINVISVAHTYHEYVSFYDANYFTYDLKTIMKLEERINGRIKTKWYIQLFGILAAYNEKFCAEFEEIVPDEVMNNLKEIAKKQDFEITKVK